MAHAIAAERQTPLAGDATVEFYDREADRYARATLASDLTQLYPELLDRLPAGGVILDAGCGAGRDTLAFLEGGFRVDAFDASAALASLATRLTGVPVEVARFEEWRGPAEWYDGIWCFASLLHVTHVDLPQVVSSLRRSLKRGGWLFASFKDGGGEEVDAHGRRYTNLDAPAARRLFEEAGLLVERAWREGGPTALDDSVAWTYVLAHRPD